MPASSDPVGPVPIHHAPNESPRKHRATKPASGRNLEAESAPVSAVPGDSPAEPTRRRGHALDFASVHSKIVRTTDGAVMVSPESGPMLLPKTDEASRLPVGAKIEKLNHETYRSTQLDAQYNAPPTVHASAVEAIAMFTAHFWPHGV